ncbi:MAG: hydrolase [Frankiales bacterium]|nr:hydrolase [Frankiales bacterium]
MSIRAVLFDFGGVFTDSPFEAFGKYADSIGATRDQIDAIVFGGYGVDGDHPWHRVERGEITLEAARDGILALGEEQGLVVDIWQVFMTMSANQGGLRHGLVEHVRVLRAAGLKTGIVTNNVVEFREHWRAMLPVAELFDVIVDSSEVGERKPNPAIFRRAVALLGLQPDEVLFLDDYPGNVTAAQELGMRAVLVDGDGAKTISDLQAALTS